MNMNEKIEVQEYIRKEREIILKECQLLHLTPAEWIRQYASRYHDRFAPVLYRPPA
jgi:hypothetical protein